ncbi:MAG: efflux transporter periplasmic adaptor subunit [Micavibrio sp.]|nr:efflux transporter periplasmic adaptor subunit [Micavibrio sp.]
MTKRIFLLSLFLLPFSAFAQMPQPQATPVIIETATIQNIADRIEALGTLRATETVDITATVTDTVTDINFEGGQRVEKDAVLVEMTSGEEQAMLDEAQSNLLEAKKQLDRARPLVEQGAASQSILDQRRRDTNIAKARLEAVQSQLKDRIILAPFDGIVGIRYISKGALITLGTLITTLNDDSEMKLDFMVPSVFLPSLKEGLEIEATTKAYPDQVFKGVIDNIDNKIDPVTRAIAVRAVIPNDNKLLKQGLLMQVDLFKNARQALVIPEEAILADGNKKFVFVAAQSKEAGNQLIAQKREIEIGTRQRGSVEILQGLNEGDQIITHGADKLRAGMPITKDENASYLNHIEDNN